MSKFHIILNSQSRTHKTQVWENKSWFPVAVSFISCNEILGWLFILSHMSTGWTVAFLIMESWHLELVLFVFAAGMIFGGKECENYFVNVFCVFPAYLFEVLVWMLYLLVLQYQLVLALQNVQFSFNQGNTNRLFLWTVLFDICIDCMYCLFCFI